MEWKTVSIGKYQTEKAFEEGTGVKILRKEKGCLTLQCAFCRGKGVAYRGGGTCFVCGGYGETILYEPIRTCIFCGGSGRVERATEISCLVCRGKGAISVIKPYERCPDCGGKGRGKGPRYKMPCSRCSGKGIVPGRKEEH